MQRLRLLACPLLLATVPVEAKPKKASKVLNLLKQVDGAGSGLDADTLRGMTPAQLQSGSVVVKDSQGKVVGAVIAPNGDAIVHVVRSFGGQPVVLAVTADGFTNDDPTFALYYASTDCTGPPEIGEGVTPSHLLLPVAGVQGGVAYYASGAVVAGETGSAKTFR